MRALDRGIVVGCAVLAAGAMLCAWAPSQPGAAQAAGTVTWQPPAGAPQRIASVDVYSLIERLMDRPEMMTPRDELTKRLNDRIAASQASLEALQRELAAMQGTEPNAAEKQQRFLTLRDEFDRLVREGSGELDVYRAGQLFDAYRMAREAANAVATRLGYTVVISSRGQDAELTPQGMALGIQELLARPMLKSDPADDLTARVAEELKLP